MKKSLFTFQFILLCLSGSLFFSSFNMLIPELPAYLASMGGEKYIGYIISLFTVTAGLSRPFSGKLADTIGRVPVMLVGAFVCVICGFLYPLTNSVLALLALRLMHGFSTGFKPTGTAAYVADIVPDDRRGEAMGVLGFFSSIGIALGPLIGSMITQRWGIDVMFFTSSAFAFLSVFILFHMKETLPGKHRFRPGMLRIHVYDIYTHRVLPAAIVMLFTVYGFGVVLTITPDLSDHLEVSNKGIFFSYFTLASLFVRIFMGKMSDKFGREPVILINIVGTTCAFIFIAFADTELKFILGALMLGTSVGGLTPAVFAWAIDLSDKNLLGRSMATLYIALEIGIGVGAWLTGYIYQGHIENVKYVFGLAAMVTMIAFFYLIIHMINGKRINLNELAERKI
ncbi:MAG: MFS transporter [Calditrichaeota bacterium]|nr:MAG: MFS transporter [Calditrichota bacterium]